MLQLLKQRWWKALGVILLIYTIIAGFAGQVPDLAILNESIRNLYFHVPMWFSMILLLLISVIQSLWFLNKGDLHYDLIAKETAYIGVFFGILGLVTGMIWANYTWGSWWVNDPKLNGALVGVLIYFAYFILRGSINEEVRRAKVSAVYSIFAFVLFIAFIFVIPRLTDSLHPGSGGNPAFSAYDLDNNMRLVFYPAVLGWFLIGGWLTSLKVRISILRQQQANKDFDF